MGNLVKSYEFSINGDACYQVPTELCLNYVYNIQLIKNGVASTPLVTVEHSSNGVNWDYVDDCALNVPFNTDSITFRSDSSSTLFYRVCVTNNDGVIDGKIDLKISR